jgi:hypothetical protein
LFSTLAVSWSWFCSKQLWGISNISVDQKVGFLLLAVLKFLNSVFLRCDTNLFVQCLLKLIQRQFYRSWVQEKTT